MLEWTDKVYCIANKNYSIGHVNKLKTKYGKMTHNVKKNLNEDCIINQQN